MRTLHEKCGGIFSASDLERYEQRIEKLRARLVEFRGQIDAMVRDALAAAGRGDAAAVAELMRRLSAIHVARPRLLDESGLERIRRDIIVANEGHEDGLTTGRLIERERAVVAKMKRLANAVNDFHRIVCTLPETSAEFRRAEEVYLQVLREVRLHEDDWLAEFVLEFADVLAEWSVPPPARNSESIVSSRRSAWASSESTRRWTKLTANDVARKDREAAMGRLSLRKDLSNQARQGRKGRKNGRCTSPGSVVYSSVDRTDEPAEA